MKVKRGLPHIFSRILFAVAIIVATHIPGAQAWQDRRYEDARAELISSIHIALISHAVCQTANDCTLKKVMFVGPRRDGLNVEIYSITDPAILLAIVKVCAKTYFDLGGRADVIIKVFSYSKEEWMQRSFRNRDVLYEMKFSKGDNNAQR